MAYNLSSSSHGRFSCAASDPSRTVVEIRMPYAIYPFLVFAFATLPASPALATNAQTDRFIVGQATVSEGASCPLYLFQRPSPNLQPTWLRRRANLEAEFNTIDLFPQDLVGRDILRECSQSRDAELREVDSFDSGEWRIYPSEASGRSSGKFVFFSVMSVANNDFTCS